MVYDLAVEKAVKKNSYLKIMEVAQSLAKRWADLFNEAYGDHPQLKTRIREAYTSGAVPQDYRMFGPEVMEFIKKAQAAAGEKKR